MYVSVQIRNRELARERVVRDVFVGGCLSFDLSADEAAERMRDAWQRVVVPVQDGLKAINSSFDTDHTEPGTQGQQ